MDFEREPSAVDFLREWLFECKIENETRFDHLNDIQEVKGFGWRIEIDKLDLILTSRMDNDTLKVSIADPNALELIKTKILQVQDNAMDYIIEHVDGKYWSGRKPPPSI